MSSESPRLSLPYLLPSQAQKHVTHNEALERLDLLAQLHVLGFEAETPPAAPEVGDAYALGATPTGAWAGEAGMLAHYQDNAWAFIAPVDGWLAVASQTGDFYIHQAGSWQISEVDLNNLDGIGIQSVSDATNRLSVSAPATLLSHEGAGHQLKINKASGADTASLLFQDNWSGRAEMGLTGDDDFSIKVSGDGSSWNTGLKVAADTGFVTTPQLSSGYIEVDEDSTATIATPSSGGFVLLTMVDVDYPQAEHSAILVYDTGSSLNLATLTIGLNMDNRGTTAMTGTTGDVGRTSVAVNAGGLQIENRRVGVRRYSYTFIGGS